MFTVMSGLADYVGIAYYKAVVLDGYAELVESHQLQRIKQNFSKISGRLSFNYDKFVDSSCITHSYRIIVKIRGNIKL